jgi:hypothetical protein
VVKDEAAKGFLYASRAPTGIKMAASGVPS